jgi:hypothetical protein
VRRTYHEIFCRLRNRFPELLFRFLQLPFRGQGTRILLSRQSYFAVIDLLSDPLARKFFGNPHCGAL